MKPVRRLLFVEGGGDHNHSLRTECRKAFSKLFERAGIQDRPRVVVCGGRQRAYDQFCEALSAGGTHAWLLVDAEDSIASGPPFSPWTHVRSRVGDGWARPAGATDGQLHLMTVCMETWLLSDRDAMTIVFGPKLNTVKLPRDGSSLESQAKGDVYKALAVATKSTPAGKYGKGSHSFRVLQHVSPAKLRTLSWAARFLDAMADHP